ncbi:UNC93-like protein MFSD11-like protein [Leptotrombidium deliense]|uniref:UNC93-like protein MFSD11 n=1 Tax=Leptotrombidium deliense TaxID=299467 RepID=A0A443STH5_9ACAR|nr:UNC93-like protein MFSD11-like protein [Leptotrombidium deliense]
MDTALYNVILLGLSFFLVFTSFQTGGMIQNAVIDGVNDEYEKEWGTPWKGYYSFFIIYGVLSVANWIAPSVVAVIGPKIAMIAGAATYCIFVANFLYPMRYGLYIVSIIVGLGAGIIWTGQGNFLTLNSNAQTMARNSGLFWAMLQCSLLFGNLFVYFQFEGKDRIESSTRLTTYAVLTSVGVLGTILMVFLRPPRNGDETTTEEPLGPITALTKAFALVKTKNMLLLCVTFLYTGLELAFFSVVYGTAIGYTLDLAPDPKRFIGISGMLIGAGEILGGAIFGILGSKTIKKGRDPIILFGFVVHMLAFSIIYYNLPSDASLSETLSLAFIKSSLPLALFCSFLLGFGDSCYNTQIYSILGSVYSQESAPAFAVFKFVQSIAAAVAFIYANLFGLHVQIYILAITSAFGTLSFCVVEWAVFCEAALSVRSSNEHIN